MQDTAIAMNTASNAARAYAASSAFRSIRAQEADVFRRANMALRKAESPGSITYSRAVADNTRLWSTVIDLMKDPDNQLPSGLRASIVSVGMTVLRELSTERPDLEFVANVNENIAAGLAAAG